MRPLVGMVSLGCAKNLVDSEVMLGLFKEAGYPLTSRAEEAEILIVNTCAFIDSAKEEAINAVIEMGEYKKAGKCRFLIVAGCLAQRYREELLAQLPEIDALVGTGQFPRVVGLCEDLLREGKGAGKSLLGRPDYLYDELTPRLRVSSGPAAYLKIAEGCNHRCTYCVIPELRGPLRSRLLESVLRESRVLAVQGVKEINLIAQDTTSYGQDLGEAHNLPDLLRGMVKVEGLAWVRLLYGHPANISDELLALLAGEEKICSYLDIPLQHVQRGVLKSMGRRGGREEMESLIGRLREKVSGIVLRTSLIVGFPGETERDFAELADFVKKMRFERLGVFTYSREEGTPAAELSPQVPEEVKNQRRDYLMRLQQENAFAYNESLVGGRVKVLVCEADRGKDSPAWGRTFAQAPEVDGVFYFPGGGVKAGRIYEAHVSEASAYDLAGEVVSYEP